MKYEFIQTCLEASVPDFIKAKTGHRLGQISVLEHMTVQEGIAGRNKQHADVKSLKISGANSIMREAACDFFPDFDAHSHVDGSCPKEWVSERHNYHAMAFLSRSYNFQWSRWNVSAGSRNIIMQLREAVDKKREAKFQLLQVTPQRANILKCIELSQEFNMEPMLEFPFYPDLFTLNMSYGSVDARRATFSMKYRLVETVFEMLQELKLSSYS